MQNVQIHQVSFMQINCILPVSLPVHPELNYNQKYLLARLVERWPFYQTCLYRAPQCQALLVLQPLQRSPHSHHLQKCGQVQSGHISLIIMQTCKLNPEKLDTEKNVPTLLLYI